MIMIPSLTFICTQTLYFRTHSQGTLFLFSNQFCDSRFLFSSFQFSRSVVSESLRPHGMQQARPLCPSPALRVYSNLCSLSQWCHPIISSSFITFISHLQSFPESGSFQMSQFFASGGQSTEVTASTSVLPMNIHD